MASTEQLYRKKLDQARRGSGNAFVETGESLTAIATGSKIKAPLEAFKLALKLRREVENHQSAPWLISLTIAILCDSMDFIPIAGWVVALFFRPFLFFFLWGRGTWRIRMIRIILLLLDFVPVVNFLPWSTISVIYAYLKSKGKVDRATNELRTLEA